MMYLLAFPGSGMQVRTDETQRYEVRLDELVDLHLADLAIQRTQTYDPSKAISHEEML